VWSIQFLCVWVWCSAWSLPT